MSASTSVSDIGDYHIVGRLEAPGREMYAALLNRRSFVLALFDVDAPATEAMLDEVKRSAKLHSNTLLPVVDAFRHNGQHAAVFEAVEGVSLLRLLRSVAAQGEKLSDGAIAYVGSRLMEALAIAHEATDAADNLAPLVHGELGPHQMFISWGGVPRLMGIGLSSIFALAAELGEQPSWAQTFVAPEVQEGAAITLHSNRYSAAFMLWSMYANQPSPIPGPLPSLADIRPDLPADIVGLIDRSLGERPHKRVDCRLFVKTLRKHMNTSDLSELADRVKALRSMVPAGTPIPPEAIPASRISPPPPTINEVFASDDAPTTPSHQVQPRLRRVTPYPPPPHRITVKQAASQRPTGKLRAMRADKASRPGEKDEEAKRSRASIPRASVRPAMALPSALLSGPGSRSSKRMSSPSSGKHTRDTEPAIPRSPAGSKPPRDTEPAIPRSRVIQPPRRTLSGRSAPNLDIPPSHVPSSERSSVALPKRAKGPDTVVPRKRSTIPSMAPPMPLDAPFEEQPLDLDRKGQDDDTPRSDIEEQRDTDEFDQPTAKSRVAPDVVATLVDPAPPSEDRLLNAGLMLADEASLAESIASDRPSSGDAERLGVSAPEQHDDEIQLSGVRRSKEVTPEPAAASDTVVVSSTPRSAVSDSVAAEPSPSSIKKFPWGWLVALVGTGALCFGAGIGFAGRAGESPPTSNPTTRGSATPAAGTSPPVVRTATAPDTAPSAKPTASADSAAAADSAAPAASSAPASQAPPVAADVSKLKPGEAYLVVTQPAQSDAHVYVNGQLLGKPATALVIPCGRPKNIRLGTNPLRRWYGRGRAMVIACKKINTVTIDTVTVNAEVPAGAPYD